MDATKLISWLPFDESTTADKCGGMWTTSGSPAISDANAINGKALQLNGSSYIQRNGTIKLGGKDFTISWYVTMNSSTTSWGTLFEATTSKGGNNRIEITRYGAANTLRIYANEMWGFYQDVNIPANTRFHLELDYQHSASKLRIFVDGVLAATVSKSLAAKNFIALTHGWGTICTNYFTGTIDEFQIYDGVALHTTNFTPPTAADYEDLAFQLDGGIVFTVDVERRISNRVEFTADVERKIINAWRYVNLGTADKLTTAGTTLENLPATKSVTGTAFYQTTRDKCFDLPATDEVWLKFDVYFDGSNRWRAYNGGANGTTGLTAQTSTEASFFSNGTNVKQFDTGTVAKNQLQTVLLHMISGSSAGVIEAWVDGAKIYTYTGDVNHGEEFADIYLQSDGAGTFFSNVVISNRQLTQADGYQSFTADVERRISNVVEFTVDVERDLIETINVPFLMGDHFNHLIEYLYCDYDGLIKIKLPKKSKVYLHADGINGGAVKIYSDTDATGTVTGDVYAALDDCEKVYIKSAVSPQSILNDFMYWLKVNGAADLDGAINYCTGGLFASKDEVINSFFYDHDNKAAGDTFLSDYCGVILDNEDTGAVIGSDAGGGYPKTAKTIVPEPIPVEDWIVPERGSSKIIEGLTVNFPTSGYNGAFTNAENHILAGLNSVWIEQALLLVNKSCGLSFVNWANSGLFSVGRISVKFVNETNNTLAYVAVTYTDNRAEKLELRINMYAYGSINTGSEDGAASATNTYLDRTLAHEMTHAIMAACIYQFNTLPLFIKEGIAEFIHGIDDTDTARIRYVHHDNQRSKLESIFSTGGGANDLYVYAAGYLFFRYLIKQTLERGNVRPSSATVTNLFISDGEVDYYGRALTDNTRQSFSVDVLRELIKTTSFTADVAIFDMIRVEFAADVMRSIIGKVKLYAGDNSAYFEENPAGNELTPVVIPSQSLTDIGRSPAAPNNTNGLQSVEIEIAEQHVTENVHFVSKVPFDIMYPVRGQYLDYLIDMRVERVQKHGILYSCDCCSDIDEILFTQLAYTIPENTPWPSDEEKPADQDNEDSDGGEDTDGNTDNTSNTDGDSKEEKIYPLASAHAMYLAAILGRTPVIQFKDFNSTVLANESGGVTYADLIREIFYWTSRIPTMLINVFIRGDKIYFVQRGYEARLIDLTGTKHTIPTVTHDLVRMTWGSTLWSKTETREYIPFETSTDDDNYSSDDDGDGYDDDDDDDDSWTNIGKVVTSDNDGETYTTYHYTPKGVLIKTVVVYTSSRDRKESYRKSIVNGYAEGLIRKVTTKTRFPAAHESDSTTVTTYGYLTLPDKTQFLATEMTVEYDYKGMVVNRRVTSKSPTGRGQGTAHDNEGNEDTSRNSGDDRVSPYQRQQASKTAKAFEEEKNADEDTQKESRTVNGLSLYDSAFPVHGDDKLIEITEAIKWLNRRTKETVTMTIYEYPHLIDFNDRIIFEGNVYFLVSNTAKTTERIFNEQRITMVRWY